MKTKIILSATLFSLMFFLPACNGGDQEQKETTETTETTTEKSAYKCPMGCEGDKTYEAEGQCPVCKMDLEKV